MSKQRILSVPRAMIQENGHGVRLVCLGLYDGDAKSDPVYGFVAEKDLQDAADDYFLYNKAPTKTAPEGPARAFEYRIPEGAVLHMFATENVTPKGLKEAAGRGLCRLGKPSDLYSHSAVDITVEDLDSMNRNYLSYKQRHKSVKQAKDRNNAGKAVRGAFGQVEFDRTEGDAVVGVWDVHRVKPKTGDAIGWVRTDLGQLSPDGSVGYISAYVRPGDVSKLSAAQEASDEYKGRYQGRNVKYEVHLTDDPSRTRYTNQARNSERRELTGLKAADVAERNNGYHAKRMGMLPDQALHAAMEADYEMV